MITVSLCMIIKDEEATLGRCLDSIAEAIDEIIIVDTGSTDRTKEIARQYTEKIYDFPWIDDFAAARNFSFSKASMDYLMWLDADDVLLEEDRAGLLQLKQTLDPAVDLVMMPYCAGSDEQGNPTLSYLRERLFKRIRGFQWNDPVHEYVQPSGKIIQTEIRVTHRKQRHDPSDRNLRIYEKMRAEGRSFSPRSLLYYGMELYYHQRYLDAAREFETFLEGAGGWVEDNIKACFYGGKCYHSLGDTGNGLKILLRSFEYDLPRAEICCEIGAVYKTRGEYGKACFWYQLAADLPKPRDGWGFVFHDYWGFVPYLELCVCHYRLGDMAKAVEFNQKAAAIKPQDPAVLFNQQFFAGMEREASLP